MLLACTTLSACTLVGLDELSLRRCATHADCAVLDVADGIADGSCVRWQCRQGACVLAERDLDGDGHVSALHCESGRDCDDDRAESHPGADEICNGHDDDCDGEVDALAAGAPPPPSQRLAEAVTSLGATTDRGAGGLAVSYVTAEGAGLAVTGGGSSRVRFERDVAYSSGEVEPGCRTLVAHAPLPPTRRPVGVTETTCQQHADCDDGVLCNGWETCEPRSPEADPDTGCRAAGATACPGGFTCDEEGFACVEASEDAACEVAELAAAFVGDGALVAVAVDDVGCAAGRARVGLLDEASAALLVRGDARRSTAWPAVDAASGCAGDARVDGAPRGLRAPRVAALSPDTAAGRRRPQALAAWLADCHGAGTACAAPGASVAVEVLGLWVEEGTAGAAPVEWVNASNDGIPLALGWAAAGSGPPALLSHPGLGYVVAFGDAAGGVALRRLPPLADPAEVSELPPHASRVGDAPRRSSPLPAPGGPPPLASGDDLEPVTAVALAAAPGEGDRPRLGVAWTGPSGLWFSIADVDPETFDASGWQPRRLTTGDAADPSIVWAEAAMAGPDGPAPGWAIVFRDATSAMLVRLGPGGGTRDGPVRLGAVAARPYADAEGRVRALTLSPDGGLHDGWACGPRG